MNKSTKLLGIGSNAKTVKSDKGGEYLTAIMYLAPHTQNSSGANICPQATDGCAAACLYTAGRGKQKQIQDARIRKTDWFIKDRLGFMAQLQKELKAFERRCKKLDVLPAVRLNGTSDLNWGRLINMSADFPTIQFYDYTKCLSFIKRNASAKGHSNYHLTYSRGEKDLAAKLKRVLSDTNVAVVFAGKELPEIYMGVPVVSGMSDDLRFLDSPDGAGVIVGLLAIGDAKKDTSGFVVRPEGDTHLQKDLFAKGGFKKGELFVKTVVPTGPPKSAFGSMVFG